MSPEEENGIEEDEELVKTQHLVEHDPWRRRRRRRRHVVVVKPVTTPPKPITTQKPTAPPLPQIPVHYWIPIIKFWKKNGVKIHKGIAGLIRTLRQCCRRRGKCHGKWFCYII